MSISPHFQDLDTSEGRMRFHKLIGAQLRQKSFALVEAEILQALSGLSDPRAVSAVQILKKDTNLIGHENLLEFMADISEKHFVTAVGIDLYGNDDADAQVALEISLYNDSSFPFRISSIADIQTAASKSAPWQGGFIECGYGLGVSGLDGVRRIWKAVKQTAGANPKVNALACLLEAALYSRVQACLHQNLPRLGLPKALPVIVGENDWGHAPDTVFFVERILTPTEVRPSRSKTKEADKPSWARQMMLDRNEKIRTTYETVSQLPPKFLQSKTQKKGVKLTTDLMRAELAFSNIDMPKNLFRMPREDFERFMSLMDRLYPKNS